MYQGFNLKLPSDDEVLDRALDDFYAQGEKVHAEHKVRVGSTRSFRRMGRLMRPRCKPTGFRMYVRTCSSHIRTRTSEPQLVSLDG